MKKPKILRARWIIPAIIIIAAGGGFYYYKYYKSASSSTQAQTLTRKVRKGTVSSTISASGIIETANYLAVTTSVNGIIKDVFVKEGDPVTEGQKLMEVTLDNSGEQSQTSALASYKSQQIQVQQQKDKLVSLQSTLRQKGDALDQVRKTTSYSNPEEKLAYDTAYADYVTAKSAYDLQSQAIAQSQLSLSASSIDYKSQSPIITAPANGVVANIVAVKGMKVENSVSEKSIQTVASIKQEGTPLATVNTTEIDINKVKVGQKVNLTLSSVDDEKFTGTVVGIDRIGASTNGVSNYPVIIQFDEDSDKVLPNMSVDAEIIAEQKDNVVVVPSTAITKDRQGVSYVNVVKNGVPQRTEVKTGLVGNDTTEILSGVNEGDEVAVTGFARTGFVNTNATQNQNRGFGTFGGAGGGGNFRRAAGD
jgi:HlyD family secretion protein